jgi:FkbM family methyltransferase
LSTKLKHHEIFFNFNRWAGEVQAGFEIDFLGVKCRTAFFTMMRPQPIARYEAPPYPPYDEEYFEWIDLLESVASAKDRFIMFELGAGFGRWTARGAAAAQSRGLLYTLVAVEAEPTRFKWISQNLQDNGVKLTGCRLFNAAVTSSDGKIGFHVNDPASGYGEGIGGATEVDAISLRTLLAPFDYVDLVDMDVQGAEFDVLIAATESLDQKVKRAHIETHSEQLDVKILRLFRELGWKPHFLYAFNTADKTPWGRINFQGGIQSWLNPRLVDKTQLRHVRTLQNSAGWRSLRVSRRVLDFVAPSGTLRRRAITRPLHWLGDKYRRDSDDFLRRR